MSFSAEAINSFSSSTRAVTNCCRDSKRCSVKVNRCPTWGFFFNDRTNLASLVGSTCGKSRKKGRSWDLRLFPTCQVRVVRFYVCCLSFLFVLLFVLLLLPYSSPDVARCYEGPPECSGQCRTSIGSSKADWAMPDLNRGAPKRTGRTSTGEL